MGGKRMRAGGGDGGEEGEMEDSEPSYEAERKLILEENRKRMMELGLHDASNFFPARKTPKKNTPRPIPDGPPRRSSRVRSAPELYKPPISEVQRRVFVRRPAPSPIEEYTGPRRRSSRLPGPRVSYKKQLLYDSDPEEVVETTKKEARPLQHIAPRVSYKKLPQYDSDPEEVVETTKKEAHPLQHIAGSASFQDSDVIEVVQL